MDAYNSYKFHLDRQLAIVFIAILFIINNTHI